MDDLISRQATIVAIECSGLDDDSKDTVVRVIEQLPSAQPEQLTDKERFNGICPYIDKPCDDWECEKCAVNAEEAKWVRSQRTGRWSQVSGQATLCSCCGRASNAKQAKTWNYCPYCGAKMEEME